MERAYNAVVSERMNIRKASIEFDVPLMTLSNRVNGKLHLHAKLGQQAALTAGEEDALANLRYLHAFETIPCHSRPRYGPSVGYGSKEKS